MSLLYGCLTMLSACYWIGNYADFVVLVVVKLDTLVVMIEFGLP
jgi:hypothetical protein